jgi:flavin-dependent dehydrogenase
MVNLDMTTRTYDLIVVHAGPAGTMAAFHAASHGLDGLVLDRAH